LNTADLLAVSGISFATVFILLSFLAFAMRLITAFFPGHEEESDAAVVAAISSTVTSIVPGARVTRIEEER
jgi:Na+-transporting methylmalonyl-CoA/oxaloacetate decarboxylase gamma subunit